MVLLTLESNEFLLSGVDNTSFVHIITLLIITLSEPKAFIETALKRDIPVILLI